MTGKTLAEASAEILDGNVAGKRGMADKPKKLPGEETYVGGPDNKTQTPTNDGYGDPAQDVTKDKTGPAKTGSKPEGPRKLTGDPLNPTKVGEETETDKTQEVLDEADKAKAEEAKKLAEEAEAKAKALAEEEAKKAAALAEEEAAKQKLIDEVDVSEDIKAIVDGSDLSEEFKTKTKTIFETALKRKLKEIMEHLEKKHAVRLEEEVTKVTEAFDAKIEEHLNYAVEQWSKENQVAIESSLRTELTEDFLAGLKLLFEEHYIDIPEEKTDLVEEYATKLVSLEEKLNEQIEANVALTKQINEAKKADIVDQLAEGLVVTDVEKFKKLIAEVTEADLTAFTEKAKTIRESYFKGDSGKPAIGKSVNDETVLTEQELAEQEKAELTSKNKNDPMNVFVEALNRVKPGMPLGIQA
jgi:hypothetical protein